MKRFNVYEDSDACQSTTGGWVLHSDAEAAIAAAVKAEIERCAQCVLDAGGVDPHIRNQIAAAIRSKS